MYLEIVLLSQRRNNFKCAQISSDLKLRAIGGRSPMEKKK